MWVDRWVRVGSWASRCRMGYHMYYLGNIEQRSMFQDGTSYMRRAALVRGLTFSLYQHASSRRAATVPPAPPAQPPHLHLLYSDEAWKGLLQLVQLKSARLRAVSRSPRSPVPFLCPPPPPPPSPGRTLAHTLPPSTCLTNSYWVVVPPIMFHAQLRHH